MKKHSHTEKSRARVILALLLLPAAALHPLRVPAQSSGVNSVRVTEYLDAAGSMSRSATTYYNGMGWPVQTVMSGYNPQGSDIATMTSYDAQGRPVREWAATAMEGYCGGGLIPPSSVMAACYYGARYTDIQYDGSPLGRETGRTGPGSVWRDRNKSVHTAYLTNSASSPIIKLTMDGEDGIRRNGSWPNGMFEVTRITGEDSVTTHTFTDMHGRTLLIRRSSTAGSLDTYYVYDPLGRLRYVLPPAASEALQSVPQGTTVHPLQDSALEPYTYAYRYDERGNCTWRKLPGREYEEMLYDKDGCLAYHRDGRARAKGRWHFRLHDKYHRETVTGTTTAVDQSYSTRPFRTAWSGSGSSTYGGYMAEFSIPGACLHTVTYYDDYAYLGCTGYHSADSARFEHSPLDTVCGSAKGRVTGMRAYEAADTATAARFSLYSVYYDEKGRILQERVSDLLGGYSRDFHHYSFDGRRTWHRHRDTTRQGRRMTVDHSYLYDSRGFPTAVYCYVNGKPVRITATYTHDTLGRLSGETLGQTETVTHTYNVRSWPAALTGTLFSEHLAYGVTEGQATVDTPRFGGDLSAVAWKAGGAAEPWRRYAMTYDGAGRLTEAAYAQGSEQYTESSNRYGESFSYDAMGNITQIERRGMQDDGTYSPIDDLSLTYDGNRLAWVEENAEDEPAAKGTMHFTQAAGTAPQYAWDANGNMTADRNRGIAGIAYDALDRPVRVTNTDGTYTDYTYDASGRKLRSAHPPIMGIAFNEPLSLDGGTSSVQGTDRGGGIVGPGSPGGEIVGPIGMWEGDTIEYCGNTVVFNGQVKRVAHDKGYITFDDQGEPLFHYYLRDHLGSVRVVFNENDSVEQVNHYYPSGVLMDFSTGADTQPMKYTGKELVREWGMESYDYGARWMLPVTGPMFTQPDPLSEKYYDISPYAYCANNPIRYNDPSGMIIEERCLTEWCALRTQIETERNQLQMSIDKLIAKANLKGWSLEKLSSRIGDRTERIKSLSSSLATMDLLENSTQVYNLTHSKDDGSLKFDSKTSVISIYYNGVANFVHELTHAGQFESGDLAFLANGKTVLQDIYDEVAAYKAQYAWNPSSVSSIFSTSTVNSFEAITTMWVQGIQSFDGIKYYAPGGIQNTGVAPLNINSKRDDFIRAYPQERSNFQGLPDNFNVLSIKGIYYKR